MKSMHNTERTEKRKKCWQCKQPAQASELRNVSREKISGKCSSKDPVGMHGTHLHPHLHPLPAAFLYASPTAQKVSSQSLEMP